MQILSRRTHCTRRVDAGLPRCPSRLFQYNPLYLKNVVPIPVPMPDAVPGSVWSNEHLYVMRSRLVTRPRPRIGA